MSDDRSIHDELRITCADALELITEYLDDALAPRDLDDFTTHLRGCQACTVYVEQFQQTIQLAPLVREDVEVDSESVDRLVAEFARRRDDTS